MPWFRTPVRPDGRDWVDVQSLFLTAFHAVITQRGSVPATMALFSTEHMGAERYYYFTPDTKKLAPEFIRAVRAQPCDRPKEPVRFEVGDDSARAAFERGEL